MTQSPRLARALLAMLFSCLSPSATSLAQPAQLAPEGEAAEGEAAEGEAEADATNALSPASELATPEEARPAPEPPVQFTLSNGLRVILRRVPGRRFSALAMTYGVGSRDVPRGWTGLAHLTEHLMFSGTDRLDEVEVYLRLEAAGAVERNAETNLDRTVYYEVVPGERLDETLELEAERMAHLLSGLTPQRLERQREVVLHEGWERGAYGWRGRLARSLFLGTLPTGHPYAENVVERPEDVRAIALPHVQWFFQRHYGPDDATLTIVGGFELAPLRAAIERHFGGVVRSAPPAPALRPAPVSPLETSRRIEIEIQHDRDQLYLAWPTPALYAAGDAELDVISSLLADRRDSPLRAALVETGLALDVAVRQRSYELASVFSLHVVPAPGRSPDELRAVVDRVLREVHARGFSPQDITREAQRWARFSQLSVEDLESRASRLALATPEHVPTVEAETARYLAVDAEAVAAALRRWLPADRRLELIARANPQTGAAGRALRDTPVSR